MEEDPVENPMENPSAWESIYNYVKPSLKREYDIQQMRLSMETNVLTEEETQQLHTNINNEIRRIIYLRNFLKRSAGH